MHELGADFSQLHSLVVADLNGDGAPDIFTAEMQSGGGGTPRLIFFINDGRGRFTRHEIENPGGTHESRVLHLNGARLPSLLLQPYAPHRRLELLENVTAAG